LSETSTYRSELIARIRAATDDLAWAVRGLPPADQQYRPNANEWTIHQHVSHMRDMEEAVYLPLLRWATVPEMLDPLDYNRRDWLERRYDPEEALSHVLNDLVRIRDEELMVFRDMTDGTWTAFRTDTRWGPLTCQWIAELIYRHALDHLQGIMALKQDLHLAALQPPPSARGFVGGKGS
jgi:hypothetical protein